MTKLNINKLIDLNKIGIKTDSSKATTLYKYLKKFPGCKIEQTTNGFVIKFPNGFMIQGKEVYEGATNPTQNNSIWTARIDLGDWDIPFKTFMFAHASITRVAGDRTYWLGGYMGYHNPSATSCGIILVNESWNGLGNAVGVLSIGFGYWK